MGVKKHHPAVVVFMRYSVYMFLGGSLSAFAGLSLSDWRWWAIDVPMILLIALSKKAERMS